MLSLCFLCATLKSQDTKSVNQSIAFDLLAMKNPTSSQTKDPTKNATCQLTTDCYSLTSNDKITEPVNGSVLRIRPLRGQNKISILNGTGTPLNAKIFCMAGNPIRDLGEVGSKHQVCTDFLPGGKYVLVLQNLNTGEKISQRFNKRKVQI